MDVTDKKAEDTWEIELVPPPAAPDLSDSAFVKSKLTIKYVKGFKDADNATTKTVTEALKADRKRYVVFSNDKYALVDQDGSLAADGNKTNPNSFRDVTIFYLDIPFWANFEDFKPFGIEARVKLSKLRDGAQTASADTGMVWGGRADQGAWGQIRQGIMMGVIENPATIDQKFDANGLATTDAAPDFIGWRIGPNGQRRIYAMRANNTYGSYQVTAGNPAWTFPGTQEGVNAAFGTSDYLSNSWTVNTAKKEAFVDQEYVYKVERNTATTYQFNVFNADKTGNSATNGGGLTNNYDPGAAAYRGTIKEDVPMYLAFMVYGVEAEISDLKIYYGDQVWVDDNVKDAVPTPVQAKRVDITATPKGADLDDGNDSTFEETSFEGVQLTAEVIPVTANQEVAWSIAPGTILNLLQNNVIRGTGTGTGVETITATPTIGGATGTYKINLMDHIPRATNVTINAPSKTELRYGEKINLTATVTGEVGLTETGVTWKVVKGADNAAATEAWVYSDGEFEADFTAADQDVKVIATSKAYGTAELGKGLDSAPVTIKIKAFAKTDLPVKWTFGAGDRIPANWKGDSAATNTTSAKLAGGLTLIPPNNGNIAWREGQASGGSGNALGYVGCIQPNTGGWSGTIVDFGIPVKVTIVGSNTGDSDTAGRKFNIKYGSDGQIETAWDAPGQAMPDVLGRAFFVTQGQGAITFGANASVRVFEIKVEDPDAGVRLSGLTLSANSETIAAGASTTLPTVTKVPENATDDYVWVSTDLTQTYVTVNFNTGAITAKAMETETPVILRAQKKGDATIKAEFELSLSRVPLTGITVPATFEIPQGLTDSVTVIKTPAGASDQLEWTSSDPSIASVDATTGVITGVLKGGPVTITVTNKKDSTVTKNIAVTVTDPPTPFWTWATGDGYITDGKIKGVAAGHFGGTAANIILSNGRMNLAGARFVLGSASSTALSTSTWDQTAELDLSKKFRIEVTYAASANVGNFWVYIYNNGAGSGNGPVVSSIYGDTSSNAILLQVSTTQNSQPGNFVFAPGGAGATVAVNIDPANLSLRSEFTSAGANTGVTKDDVLKKALLQFRCDGANTSFQITSIKLYYLE